MPSTRRYDAKRTAEYAWRKWYGTQRWKSRRAEQLRQQPLCERCLASKPCRITPASVAHHRIPHRGDPVQFWRGSLESLCANCHDADAQQFEKRGYDSRVGDDGVPVDKARHPFFR